MKNLKSKLRLSLCLLIVCFSTFAQTDSHDCEIVVTRADLEKCATYKRQNELLEKQIKFQAVETVSLRDTIKARNNALSKIKIELKEETETKESFRKTTFILAIIISLLICLIIFGHKLAKFIVVFCLFSAQSFAQAPDYRPPFTLNGQKGLNQKIVYDTTANKFSIESANDVHTIKIPYNKILSVISNDTLTRPTIGNYRIALPTDGKLRIINSAGKVFPIQNIYQPWALKPIVIDSTLSGYTIVDNRANNFVLASIQNFSNTALGKYNIYTSNLYYYLPKFIPNYTIAINLPNPSLTSSANLVIHLTMNKRCTINFNYPIYYTLKNGDGNLTANTDYGLTQMNPTLQTIPTTNFKARWFVSHDSSIYEFYVSNNKWYIN